MKIRLESKVKPEKRQISERGRRAPTRISKEVVVVKMKEKDQEFGQTKK